MTSGSSGSEASPRRGRSSRPATSGRRTASAPRRLGIHVRSAAGLTAAARHAEAIGCTTFQIMSGNPSAWNPGALDPRQAGEFREFIDEHDLRPAFLHAGYLINLSCRSGRNAPLYAKSVKLLEATVERAAALSCEYVVFHMGSRRGSKRAQALKALVEGICRLEEAECAGRAAASGTRGRTADAGTGGRKGAAGPDRRGPALLLENSAGSGETVGSSFEELAEVLAAAERHGAGIPLGICLDTAHMWGAGYDLGSAAAAKRLVDDFDKVVGINRLHLIHLNDSPVERGARRDKHEHLGCGSIPLAGLRAVARHPKLRRVAMILETPGSTQPSDRKRMDDLRELAGV